jgi:uncharacterized membrane protein required for colicin V production
MSLQSFSVNWVDWAVMLVLLAGVVHGRRRGMSGEILDVFKWLCIVVAAGALHGLGGELIAANTSLGLLYSYLSAYVLIALVIGLVFSFIKRRVGEKFVRGDTFGNGEYYLGMFAGGLRYACIVVVAFALLHARRYSADELQREVKFQEDNFGSSYFPTVGTLQQEVFKRSFIGQAANDYLSIVLISGTSPQQKSPGVDTPGVKARERALHEVLDK